MSTASDPAPAAIQRGQVLCDMGRYADAVPVLSQAVASEPQNAGAWCLLALAQLGQGRHRQGAEAAQRAAALAPELEWPHRLMSIAEIGLGNPGMARRHAETAVRLAPYEWRAHLQLGTALLRTNDVDDAVLCAKRALELAPHAAETNILAGRVAHARGRRGEAAVAFRRALAIDPNSSVAHNELARLKLRKWILTVNAGRLATAAAGFADAVRADPNSEVSRGNLELVLNGFLRLLAYYIFLVAWIVGVLLNPRVTPAHGAVTLAAVALPAAYATWFVVRLPVVLRRHLMRFALTGGRWLGVGLEAAAILALLASAVAPSRTAAGLAVVALVPAILARLVLWALRS